MKGWKNKRKQNKKKKNKKKTNQPSDTCCLIDLSNMHIFTVTITQIVWTHLTNLFDLRYFCEHNPLFYHLNLIPCHYLGWKRNI